MMMIIVTLFGQQCARKSHENRHRDTFFNKLIALHDICKCELVMSAPNISIFFSYK